MYCEDCKFWTRNGVHKNPNYGDCRSAGFAYQQPDGTRSDQLIYGDNEYCAAFFETGQLFGCVHFEDK